MLIIKRYPNRKLYDTEKKQYVTLDKIAILIQEGKDIQVIDHSTGEDLTAVTLSQIIFEQEKKQSGFVPKNVLAGLVQAGGDTLSAFKNALTSPLDALPDVDLEIERRIKKLIQEGKLAEEQGRNLLEQLLETSRQTAKKTQAGGETYLKKLLSKRGIPSQDEISRLSEQIDNLAAKLESLAQSKTEAAVEEGHAGADDQEEE
ncbi:MAG TPA: hypothetical protein G4N96_00865 [Chloroflexi bacterium]|nr:MAG: hypothetical protein B6243_02695 [Anaerolineaceae bacterium 4572_5.2]HEY83652.1 hypothetical protein [Chloroflexota bacterium]